MIYYAIKHLPTGNYLPQLRKKRGHSHTEPLPLDKAVPRLHRTVRTARVALWYWLRGAWVEEWGNTGDWGKRPRVRGQRRREEAGTQAGGDGDRPDAGRESMTNECRVQISRSHVRQLCVLR